MKKQHIILILLFLAPVLAFATTGSDSTFNDLITELKGYLGGSLGMVFVLIGFIGAGAAIAGFAPMKVMFPVFGLTLALKYGPAILEKMFGATGDFTPAYAIHSFSLIDLLVVLVAAAMFVIGAHSRQLSDIGKTVNA